MVTVVLDAQAGSCGKGKFIGYLAKADNADVAINNFMSNAGHTYVSENGGKVMTQHLPTSLVNGHTELVIGPGAAITPDILASEIIKYNDMLGGRKIKVNPRAVVITEKHRDMEREILRSGSTFKGCGAAQADKVMRQAELFGDWYNRSDAMIKHHITVMDTMEYINDSIDNGAYVLVEGSQGCDLDINYGLPYPNTTSRQCHAGQLVADCGISPKLVDEIIMIIRPYPIRISNTTNLTDGNGNALMVSSGDYAESEEITWDIVKERCGAPDDVEFGEQTTVTKKTRRVFEMNWDRLRYVTKLNRPTAIALNFAQYIDWGAYQCKQYQDLPQGVIDFMMRVERETGVPVKLIGTGPNNDDIIDLR
ncbi:MAG: adenylosuccinate synthetase [Ruminococcus flavefaciens]|nr:adenylosuccinate synthetase [Ruminococcus flavefaciens]